MFLIFLWISRVFPLSQPACDEKKCNTILGRVTVLHRSVGGRETLSGRVEIQHGFLIPITISLSWRLLWERDGRGYLKCLYLLVGCKDVAQETNANTTHNFQLHYDLILEAFGMEDSTEQRGEKWDYLKFLLLSYQHKPLKTNGKEKTILSYTAGSSLLALGKTNEGRDGGREGTRHAFDQDLIIYTWT